MESEGALRVQLLRPNGTVVGERLLDTRYPAPISRTPPPSCWRAGRASSTPPRWRRPPSRPPAASCLVHRPRAGARYRPRRRRSPPAVGRRVAVVRLSRGVWGLGVRLTAVDFHRQPIGVGEISWNRSPVALTVRRRFGTSKGLVFELDAGIAAAVLFSRSQRLESNHATWTTDFGPTAGVQFLFDTRRTDLAVFGYIYCRLDPAAPDPGHPDRHPHLASGGLLAGAGALLAARCILSARFPAANGTDVPARACRHEKMERRPAGGRRAPRWKSASSTASTARRWRPGPPA